MPWQWFGAGQPTFWAIPATLPAPPAPALEILPPRDRRRDAAAAQRRGGPARRLESTRVHSTVDRLDADGIGILAPKSTNPPILCAAKNTPIQGVPQMPEMPLTLQGEREAGRAHGLPARRHSRARTAKQLVNWNADLIAHRFYRALRLATYYGQWLSLFSGKRGLKVGSNVQGGLSQARVYPQKVDICVSIPLRQLRAIVRNARRAKPCALRCDHVSCL
jgi:hypothetical protein